MSESVNQALILRECGAIPGIRLFRNTVGEGWQGKKIAQTRDTVTLYRPRYVTFGLAPGSSDLIGWANGLFLAIECKVEGGKARADQQRFIDAVNAAGGVAGVAVTPGEVKKLISRIY